MYPTNPARYPEFVADQVLTAQNLQDLFNYLDEQERLTRTNLIGIGIVCGLEAYVDNAGTSIKVSKGVGVTSAGYLVAMPAAHYTHFGAYNAEKETYYEKFVEPSTKKQRFPLWQLAKAGEPQAEKELSKSFLADKIILVFVELLKSGNKNCDPDSCDDKGITVDVQFKVLLVEEKNVGGLIGAKSEDGAFTPGPKCLGWPEMKLPRYNVPATTLPDSASILKGYLAIMKESFLQQVEDTLTKAYASTQLLVANDLPQNPFSQLTEKLSFLYDGTINLNQLVMVQYYYDFISDLLQGYEELRSICNRYLALCCPDEKLFPRHLLLYAAFPTNKVYRHRFIPSPALNAGDGLVNEMRFLMRRLGGLVQMVQIPPVLPASAKRKQAEVRITPSKLGDVPLSQKAIPYYYDVFDNPALFNQWNYQKTNAGKGNTNLSYYAAEYNSVDEHVRFPLRFDIEPYNFFRIEGHIGKPWQNAFQEIYKIKYNHRLPFEVVALNGDFKSLLAFAQQSIADLGKVLAEHPEQWRKILCYFSDIEMQYDMQAAELRCTIGKVMKFLYDYKTEQTAGNAGAVPQSTLLQQFDPAYRTKAATVGLQFDEWYPTVKNAGYIPPAQMLQAFSVNFGAGKFISPVALMYYLEKIHEALPAGIVQVNMIELSIRLRDAVLVAEAILKAIKAFASNTDNKQFDDPELYLQLNAVIRICKGTLLLELYRNFLFRFFLYLSNQSFAMYSFLNTGIQHKAGVPVGGTFIMVYHDAMPLRAQLAAEAAASRTTAFVSNTASTAPTMARENDAMFSRIKTDTERLRKIGTVDKLFTTKEDVSRLQSVKDAGMFYLTELVARRAAEDELTDKELLDLVSEIPDGIVIADFYLPYICGSECMPMSFVVLPGKEEKPEETEKPTISIKPAEFCNGDSKDYEFTTSPTPAAAGSVAGEGASTVNGKTVFNPSAVNLGNALQKNISFTYTVGAEKAETSATVFAVPKASFAAALAPAPVTHVAPPAIALSNVVAVGSSFSWQVNGKEVSTVANPQRLPLEGNGPQVVTLIVRNGVCPEASFSQTLTFAPAEPVLNCTSLGIWQEAFQKWNQPGSRIFTVFMRQFGSYQKVVAFFTNSVAQANGQPADKQVEILVQGAAPSTIIEWMQELNKMILEGISRPLALELFRILEGLLVFYACMQKEDIDKAKTPTIDAFKIDSSLVAGWGNVAANFSASEKAILKQKMEDLAKELDNAKQNAPHKSNYLAVLEVIIKRLSAMA